MLVITRREGEEVVIGDPANPLGVVRVASIRGDRVRIAFDFPASIQVHRKEVAQEIVDSRANPGGQPVQKPSGVERNRQGKGGATDTPPVNCQHPTGSQVRHSHLPGCVCPACLHARSHVAH